MFPTELSHEICCLHPRVDRLTLTAELRYDRNGERRGVQFYPSVIQSDERLTYTLVRKILVGEDPELKRKFSHLLPSLELMADLCQELRRRRTERGAIDFDLPEPEVILNLQGEQRTSFGREKPCPSDHRRVYDCCQRGGCPFYGRKRGSSYLQNS